MEWLVFFAGLVALAGIYSMLSLSLNIDSGYLGLWNLGTAGFFAVGAYAYTLVTIDQPGTVGLGLPMWVGFLAAGLAAGAAGFLVGLPSLRLRREHLLITTFAFAEVIRQILVNEHAITNGNRGFYGLSKPFETWLYGPTYMLYFAVMVLLILSAFYWFARRLAHSPAGRLMRAVRENEPVARSIGKDLFKTKLTVFVVSNVLVGFAGAVYIWYSSIILPNMFTSTVTFTVWTALVIGGIGNHRGAVLGAFILIFAQEFTRFFQVSPDYATVLSALRWVFMGLMLVLVLRFRPQGILPENVPSFEKKLGSAAKGGGYHASSEWVK